MPDSLGTILRFFCPEFLFKDYAWHVECDSANVVELFQLPPSGGQVVGQPQARASRGI